MDKFIQKQLIEICKNYYIENEIAVIAEPYIPFIPENWNGILVLAESQNLSKANQSYVKELRKDSPYDRLIRLYKNTKFIGVYPWDDGSLKLAIESALKVNANETAVSNAVLWSQRSGSGANKNPERIIQELSTEIWNEFLYILNPELVILAGKIAQEVINRTKWKGNKKALRLSSRNAMSRISGMFDKNDLLKRYPEVREVAEKNKSWIKDYSLNKIFYACHAVSLLKK